jgi:CheY-like chemotaxis protein
MMPDKDGIETLHELKAQSDNPNLNTPIICLTANAISGAREQYIAEGFNDYLTKPINPDKLEEMLLNYLPTDKVNRALTESVEQIKKPHLNIAMGLEHSNGEEDIYRSIVELFCNLKSEKQGKIRAAFEKSDWKNYTIFVHGLKSTALSIGGELVGQVAKDLEAAGKILMDANSSESAKRDAEEYIQSHHDKAMKLYDELVEEANRYLDSATANKNQN